ncbi:hypothetical protein Tco_0888032 [Tanacetum coccineum]
MSNTSEDIQAASSDTRPPMLDRTDYESWAQCIRLYCRGKENGHHILSSIDEGPFKMGTCRDAVGATPEGAAILGPERPRTYDDLDDNDKARFNADVSATNIVLKGLPKDIYKLINHNIKAKAIWDSVKMLLEGSKLTKEDRESQLYDEFERFKMLPGENINEYYVRFYKLVNDMWHIRRTIANSAESTSSQTNKPTRTPLQTLKSSNSAEWESRCLDSSVETELESGEQCSGSCVYRDNFKDKMLLMQTQENGAVLDEEKLLFLAGDHANTFDADVDEQPVRDMAQNDDTLPQADGIGMHLILTST